MILAATRQGAIDRHGQADTGKASGTPQCRWQATTGSRVGHSPIRSFFFSSLSIHLSRRCLLLLRLLPSASSSFGRPARERGRPIDRPCVQHRIYLLASHDVPSTTVHGPPVHSSQRLPVETKTPNPPALRISLLQAKHHLPS